VAVDVFDIQAVGVQTASGNGGNISVAGGSILDVDVDVPAHTGVTAFSLWLERSNDNGAKWYEVPFDLCLKNAGSVAAEGAARTNSRNIVNNETTSAVVAKYSASYKHLGSALIRARWFFTGTNITFGMRGAIK